MEIVLMLKIITLFSLTNLSKFRNKILIVTLSLQDNLLEIVKHTFRVTASPGNFRGGQTGFFILNFDIEVQLIYSRCARDLGKRR